MEGPGIGRERKARENECKEKVKKTMKERTE